MFKFTFSEEMTRTIGAALENMPYRIAAPVLAEMQKQITAQQATETQAPAAAANGSDRPSAVN